MVIAIRDAPIIGR